MNFNEDSLYDYKKSSIIETALQRKLEIASKKDAAAETIDIDFYLPKLDGEFVVIY